MNNKFMKCLIFMFKIIKDNKNFFHGCKHDFKTKNSNKKRTKIGLMGVCSNCHEHENNKDDKIF